MRRAENKKGTMMRILLIVLATLLGLAGPAWADAHSEFDAGNAAYNSGDLDTAIAHYTKAIESKPDYADAYYNRSVAYRGKGLFDQGIADSTKTIELKPDLAVVYLNRGALYLAKGFSDRAIADWTKAIQLKPDYVRPTTIAAACMAAWGSTTRPLPTGPG